MFGASAIGSSVTGAGEQTIIQGAELSFGNSLADANGLSVGVGLSRPNALTSVNDLGQSISIQTGFADALARALASSTSAKPKVDIADGRATALDFDVGLQLFLANARAEGLQSIPKVSLPLQRANATASPLNTDFNIDQDIDRADSSASALSMGMRVGLNTGVADSTTEVNDLRQGRTLSIGIADASAGVNDLELNIGTFVDKANATSKARNANIGLGLGQAGAQTESLAVGQKVSIPLQVANAFAGGRVLDLNIDQPVIGADANSQANGFNIGLQTSTTDASTAINQLDLFISQPLGVANAVAGSLDADQNIFQKIGLANSDVNVNGANIGVSLGQGFAGTQANEMDQFISVPTQVANAFTTIGEATQDLGIKIGRADAQSSAIDGQLLSKLSMGVANSLVTVNQFGQVVRPYLQRANAFTEIFEPNQAIRIPTQLSTPSALALNAQLKAQLALGVADATTQYPELVTGSPVFTDTMFGQYSFGTQPFGGAYRIAKARVELARAEAEANTFGFNIGLGLGRAETFTTTNVLRQGVSLFLGRPNATTDIFTFGQRQGANPFVANMTADALDSQFITFLDLGIGDSVVNGNIMIPKYGLDLFTTNVDASAFDFSGIGLGTLVADIPADAIGMNLGIGLGRVNAPAEALDARWKVFLELLRKDVRASATLIELLIALKVGLADSDAQALSLADIVYVVDEVPIISVDRIPDQSTIIVENQNDLNVNIYRADDHRGKVALLVADHDDSTDYVDGSLESSVNYKYVVAFVASGTKGGQPYIEIGERSLPVYTQGNKIL